MKNSTRILSFMFAMILLVSAVSLPTSARTLEEIKNDIEEAEEGLKANASTREDIIANIEKYDKQNEAINEQIALLDEQIAPIQANIDRLTEQITELEKKITTLEKEIKDIEVQTEEQNKAIDETYNVLGERLRASYMAGETSELEVFLSASSFEDFLTRSELLRQVAKHDNEVVAGLEEKIKELNQMLEDLTAKRTEIEESKVQLESDRAESEADMKVLQAKRTEQTNARAKVESNILKQNDLLAKLDKSDAYYEAAIKKGEQDLADWSKQLEADAGNSGSTGDGYISSGGNHNYRVSSKGYISPIQDKSVYYSATYAQHSARGTKSVDFCAPANRVFTDGKTYYTSNGAKIYAVASGTVVQASVQTSGGNFILIDHGNGMRTLYAHCRVLYVSAGQKVQQGDVIALVGNTGTAVSPRPSSANPVAGSHLHFQMLLNGSPVNPEKYLPSPLV